MAHLESLFPLPMELVKKCPTDGTEYSKDDPRPCEVCLGNTWILWCRTHGKPAAGVSGCEECLRATTPGAPPVPSRPKTGRERHRAMLILLVAAALLIPVLLIVIVRFNPTLVQQNKSVAALLSPSPAARASTSSAAVDTGTLDDDAGIEHAPLGIAPLPNPSEPTTPMEPSPPRAIALPGERYPETRTEVLTAWNLQTWPLEKLRYAINEMYARHGAEFRRDKDLQRWFAKFLWYHPRPGMTLEQIETSFTAIETYNLKVLGNYRDAWNARVSAKSPNTEHSATDSLSDEQGTLLGEPSGNVQDPNTINLESGPVLEATPAATALATYSVVGVPKGDYLNVRAGPGSQYPIVERIPANATGFLVGARRSVNGATIWKEISVNGHRGWVSAEHLSLERVSTDRTVAELEQQEQGHRSRLVYAPQPTYPYTARKALVTGSGRFRITFNEEGKAELVETVESTGNRPLDWNTMDTLAQWRAVPGKTWEIVVPITYTNPTP